MNDLLKTRPNATAKATPSGWVDAETRELLVSIRNLQERLGTNEPGSETLPEVVSPTLPSDAMPALIAPKRGPGRPRGSLAKKK
jgi:hypothetical protein